MSITLPDQPTESASERNGVFSYAGENHSFVLGAGVGFVSAATGTFSLATLLVGVALGETKANGKALREIQSEPWYAVGGLLAGVLAGTVLA